MSEEDPWEAISKDGWRVCNEKGHFYLGEAFSEESTFCSAVEWIPSCVVSAVCCWKKC